MNKQDKIVLCVIEPKTNKEMATKLHRSFAHPSFKKLLKIINSAGTEWSGNKDHILEIKRASEECQVHRIYKKSPPYPMVSLPLAIKFQETVAVDQEVCNGPIILHLIDLCLQFSVATIIPTKTMNLL